MNKRVANTSFVWRFINIFIGEIYLLLSVVIFGIAFVVMRYATFYSLGPQSFNAGRFLIATICLIITKLYNINCSQEEKSAVLQPESTFRGLLLNTNNLLWGSALGVLNFIASAFAQQGLKTVDANRAGFILGMYVVFVPMVEPCVPGLKSKLSAKVMVAAVLSLFGLYLMSGCAEVAVCMGDAFGDGEILMLLSMVVWIVSIIFGSIGSKLVDPVMLTLTNFVVATICSLACALILEPDVWVWPMKEFTDEFVVLVLVGVMQAAGFALSAMGQRFTSSTVSALIMSLEAVVCAMFGYFLLNETLSAVELCGCLIMLAATVMALIPWGNSSNSNTGASGAADDEVPTSWLQNGPFEEGMGLLELNKYISSVVDIESNVRKD